MIDYKSEEDIKKMRVACEITRDTLNYLKDFVKPGVSTYELDKLAHDYIVSKGARPTFKNYNGFPGSICSSINDEIALLQERVFSSLDLLSPVSL